jgi:outer membrane protein assembly factor BamD (BamD/ComL family)
LKTARFLDFGGVPLYDTIMKSFFALAAVMVLVSACAGIPRAEDIPEDLSVAELIQEAQNCVDRGAVKAAQVYYGVILTRHADDPAAVIAAEYELAHLKVKQKKWEEALPMLATVIQEYDADVYYQLPRAYLKLALLDMQKIPKRILEGGAKL